MKKIFLAIAAFAAAGLSGCTGNDRVGYDIDSKVLLPKNGLQQIDLTQTETETGYDVWVYRSGYNSGSSTAALSVDARALDDYNAANGTAYVLMPEAYYNLPNTSLRLDNDNSSGKIGIRLNVSEITADSPYVLPVSVVSPDTEVSGSAATVLLRPVRPEAEEPENAG